MNQLLIFGILSLPLVVLSRRSLINPKNHGFYRFFAWECMLWLLINNYPYWFDHPFGLYPLISWILLVVSLYMVIMGVKLMHAAGKPSAARSEDNLYAFEKTTALIDTGIFKYIRHPMYASLLFLSWGIFFKRPAGSLLIIVLLSTVFLYLTAVFDEKECLHYFGEKYHAYMKRSKRFIPFIF